MPLHSKSKTAAFVVRRFGDHSFHAELVERPQGREHRAILVPDFSGLEHVEGLSEVVVFVDQGEEKAILDELAQTRLPSARLSFFLCDKSIAPVLKRLSEMKRQVVFSPFPSDEPDAVMHAFEMSLGYFHKSGETHPPDYPLANTT